jgi:glycosyltransferase involved in cell wall biosynthesis
MNNQLILLTDSFPFGTKETFLEAEIGFLANVFESVHLFPLHGEGACRPQATNVVVHTPFLSFNPKNQKRLFIAGLFNRSPLGFALKEWVAKSVYKNPVHFRVWVAALLVFRASVANQKRMAELRALLNDHTVVYSYWGDKLAMLIPFLKRLHPSLKSVVRFHGGDLYEERKGGYLPFREWLFPFVQHFVCISDHGKNYLESRYPSFVQNAHLFRLGVADHGLNSYVSQSFFHVVSCSNLIALKRVHLIVEALLTMKISLLWTHIGDGPELGRIQQMVAALPSNVKVDLQGQKSNAAVIAFYQHTPIDCFLNVSESEGVPVSIMEALSFGIPVIATNAGGTGEIVDDKVGKLLPIAIDKHDIVDALDALLCEVDSFSLRKGARRRWQEQCDANKNYKEFALFLNTL